MASTPPRPVASLAPTTGSTRSRKKPDERRAEILAEAASIALDEGLERITLRAVADRLGVRPGLITHYYPAAENLVIAAFTRAASFERDLFFPSEGGPVERLAHFLRRIESGASVPLGRMWLNARHLSRFSPALGAALRDQDALDRDRLTAIVRAGIAAGEFADVDAEGAATRILIAVDGVGSSVNDMTADQTILDSFVWEVAEWTLGLAAGSLPR